MHPCMAGYGPPSPIQPCGTHSPHPWQPARQHAPHEASLLPGSTSCRLSEKRPPARLMDWEGVDLPSDHASLPGMYCTTQRCSRGEPGRARPQEPFATKTHVRAWKRWAPAALRADALRATLETPLAAARNMTVDVLVPECTDVLQYNTCMKALDLGSAVGNCDFGGANGTGSGEGGRTCPRQPRRNRR